MAKLLKLRRGTTSQHSSFTGAEGEVTVDTDKESLVVHNGSTAGGFPIARADGTGVSNFTITGELDAASLDISGDADIDGTLEADAITVNGTALDTHIAGVTVTNSTNASHVSVADNENTNENNLITFIEDASATGNVGLESDGDFHYNPSTGTVTATVFAGNLTGNVTGNTSGSSGSCTGNSATATTSGHVTVTDNENTNENNLIAFVEDAQSSTGSHGLEMDGDFTYNPSSGTVTATAFSGNLTGNVTGNTSGSSGSCTGNAATATALETARNIGGVSFDGTAAINLPGVNTAGNQDTSGTAATATNVTVADESTDTTCNVLFTTAATGDLPPKSGSNLTFNSNTGALAATSFSGDGSALTGIEGVPSGIIAMWNSTVASIPTGWVLCDGNNSTPDLRDKFIVGAKEDESSTAKTNITGSLTQTGGATTDSITVSVSGNTGTTTGWQTTYPAGASSSNWFAKDNHYHTFSGSGSATVDTIPPYYALCYIMKT